MPRTTEQSALLDGGDSNSSGIIKHHIDLLKRDVSKDYADIVLLLLTFHTGITDGAAVSTWNAFVSMQTGNTIYLGLGLADPSSSTRWQKALVSILFFMFGSFLFGHFHRIGGGSPSRRWVLVVSFILQTLCITPVAIMVTVGAVDGESMNWSNVLSIALLAIQSSGQSVATQALQYSELPTIVLTSVCRDLMSDPSLLAPKPSSNPKRNRRAIAIVLGCAGAAVSRLLGSSAGGLMSVFWVSAVIKAVVSATWLFWAPEEKEESE